MAKTERNKKTSFCKVISLLLAAIILLVMFAGCTPKEKTPEEEFSLAQKKVSTIDTQNFYCFEEFLKNVVLEEEGIDVEELFIKIGNDGIKVHVLSTDKAYTVYTVESSQREAIAKAITSEKNYIYLASHDDEGNIIYVQREFNNTIWNSLYDVEGDRILFEP